MPCSACANPARCDRAGLCQEYRAEVQLRPCTCHAKNHPPAPCPRKFALSECTTADIDPRFAAAHYLDGRDLSTAGVDSPDGAKR